MAQKTLPFEGEVIFHYDEHAPAFQEALALVRGEHDTDEQAVFRLLQCVGQHLSEYGDHERIIDGLGYVALKGEKPAGEPYTGIEVENTYADRYFD